MEAKSRWRVFFEGAPARDVYATSDLSARRTAAYANKLIGYPAKQCRPIGRAEFICFVGRGAERSVPQIERAS